MMEARTITNSCTQKTKKEIIYLKQKIQQLEDFLLSPIYYENILTAASKVGFKNFNPDIIYTNYDSTGHMKGDKILELIRSNKKQGKKHIVFVIDDNDDEIKRLKVLKPIFINIGIKLVILRSCPPGAFEQKAIDYFKQFLYKAIHQQQSVKLYRRQIIKFKRRTSKKKPSRKLEKNHGAINLNQPKKSTNNPSNVNDTLNKMFEFIILLITLLLTLLAKNFLPNEYKQTSQILTIFITIIFFNLLAKTFNCLRSGTENHHSYFNNNQQEKPLAARKIKNLNLPLNH